MEKEMEIQQKYMEFQMLDKQIKEMYQQLQQFETQGEEIGTIITGLSSFKDIKPGTKVLVPISSGIFAKATIDSSDELLMNVGSGIVVNKGLEDAKKLLAEQIEKVENIKQKMTKEINSLVEKAVPMQEELSKYAEKQA